MEHPATAVDIFYEQAVSTIAESQYQALDLESVEAIIQQLSELNLVYLQLKMGDGFIRERRTGLITAAEARPVPVAPVPTNPEVATESYDQRHYRRAQEYAKKGAWPQAIQELQDAIRIKATESKYHSLLGVAYLQQNLPGMARAYLKRAYELNPEDPLVLKFGARAGLAVAASARTSPSASQPAQTNGNRPQPSKSQAAPARSSNGSRRPAPAVKQQPVKRRSFWDWLLGKPASSFVANNGTPRAIQSDRRGWLAAWFGGR
jgi:tetratricopeptide (TPR) repeat protein